MKADFKEIYSHVTSILRQELAPTLVYHNVYHTLDVLEQAERIAESEKTNENDLYLIKVAALYHDIGFLYAHGGHEEKSCHYANVDLPEFGLCETEISRICNMIMATKIPQSPKTKLEEILCDADLDYLGRADYFAISNKLKEEFLIYRVIQNQADWLPLQIRFFENHHYCTLSSMELRNPVKIEHLQKLKELNR